MATKKDVDLQLERVQMIIATAMEKAATDAVLLKILGIL
jgi:hypothetical protein